MPGRNNSPLPTLLLKRPTLHPSQERCCPALAEAPMGAAGDLQREHTVCKHTTEYSSCKGMYACRFNWWQCLRSKAVILMLNLTTQCWPNRECPSKLGSDMTLFLYQKKPKPKKPQPPRKTKPTTIGSTLYTLLWLSSIALRFQALEWWLYENIKSSEPDQTLLDTCMLLLQGATSGCRQHPLGASQKRTPPELWAGPHTRTLNFTVHCFPRSGVCAVCTKAIYLFMACQWLYREINKAFKSKGDRAEEKVWHPRTHAASYFLTLHDKQESKGFLTQDLPTVDHRRNGKPKGGNLKNSPKL